MERPCLYAMLGVKHISTGLPYTILAGKNSVKILVDLRFFTWSKRPQTKLNVIIVLSFQRDLAKCCVRAMDG